MKSKTYLLFLSFHLLSASDVHLKSERDRLLEKEASLSLGGNTTLSDKENDVNTCIMRHKFNELDYAFDNPQYFNFSQHYFSYKDHIKNSNVYKIIKDMPKGAALHIHDMGILSPDYLMKLTYKDNLYVCFEGDEVKFKFSNVIPKYPCKNWTLVSEARNTSHSVTEFDKKLRQHFTMVVEDPEKAYPCIKDSWEKFMKYFMTVEPLLSYRPVWEEYFYDVLKAFKEQNIVYVEVRSVLPQLYELDGTVYEPLITAKAYKKATNRFLKDNPDFIGAKLIYAPPRKVDCETMDEYIQLARKIKEDMPEFFAGFDIVGQEDLGNPLIDFEAQLTAVKDLDFFFHAGETDWFGTATDTNLVDAIILGAKRLGHAYALPKHPLLRKEVIKRDIGIEVNVISNAVLSLVKDIRNHPLSTFIAEGMPVVLSSDDPGAWEADPISHDYYVAFTAVASKLSDLKLLKALALNSIKYSALKGDEKSNAFDVFHRQWDSFIDNFNCSRYTEVKKI
ncbi:hypothetical protein O0L34_g11729 [Tuta absoluta]|nr:hypothetical protein O0L34_g11729 [Tuta absoluta]